MKLKLALLISALFAVAQARADWTQAWNETATAFDTIAVYSTSGAGFATPTNVSFDTSGWAEMYSSSSWAFAQGPTTGSLTWTMNYLDPRLSGDSFDFVAWSQGQIIDSAEVFYTPNSPNADPYGFTYGAVSQSYGYPTIPSTPDGGSTVALLGGALMVLAALRRKLF